MASHKSKSSPQISSKARSKSNTSSAQLMLGSGDFNCVFVVDENATLVEVSKSAGDLLGETEFIGRRIYDLFFWMDSDKHQQALRSALEAALQDETVQYQAEVRLKEDVIIVFDINVIPISQSISDPSVDFVVITVRNITQQKLYQKELMRIYNSYHKLLNANVVGMFVVDNKGVILEANSAFTSLLGYSRNVEESELKWGDLFVDTNLSVSDLQTLFRRGVLDPGEKNLKHKNESNVPVILTAVKINRNPAQALCMLIDISERKELEHKKDEFMSIASHELKTPLTSLKGYVQLLEQYSQQGRMSEVSTFMEKINQQISKMISLIEDLLNSSRIDLGKLTLNKKDLDLVSLISELVAEARSMYPEVEINLKTDVDSALVQGDSMRIGQVFGNLISNAVKYSPKKKRIEVRINTSKEMVTVSVRDFGIGIPADKIPFLFDKYYRDVRRLRFAEGLGLGLYISSEIMKQHQGMIGVKSKLSKGSTFWFALPLK